MEVYSRKNLDIKRLLALGILDIRGMAQKDEALLAGEYFDKVERFIEDAPETKKIIEKVTKLEENARALKELEAKLGVGERDVDFTKDTAMLDELNSLRQCLSDIGYLGLDAELNSICTAINGSDLSLTQRLAVEAMLKFDSFYNSIKPVYIKKRFGGAQPNADEGEEGDDTTLTQALERLDYEEANRKLRVLAVDDVSVVLNNIISILSPHYEVFALKNSSQIGTLLAQTTPELFILDIEMNELSGFDLVPLIRKYEEHKDTPIIFLTGNASYNNVKDAIALGACDFITKPVSKEVLIEKVSRNIIKKKFY